VNRVLIVDDSLCSQKLHQMYAHLCGFIGVDVVTHGAEAVTAAQHSHYDCILIDINMPVMDGLAATREIRALEAAAGRKPAIIVAVTGSGADKDDCFAAGVNYYVPKCDPEQLFSLLSKLVEASPPQGSCD
jgi:two-component system, sensor histidine kinase and response regulator